MPLTHEITNLYKQDKPSIGINGYDEEKAKLREGNFIELVLDTYEGISLSRATAAIAQAQVAKTIAKK